MTVLVDDGSTDPRTHVLVVGVGKYDHLDDPRHQKIAALGLEPRLTSPPKSAQALTRFFDEEFDNPSAPLGSLAVLLSGTRGSGRRGDRTTIEQPSMTNLTTAVRQWAQRCDRSEGNIAIFYFCGHGLARVDVALLASDFADPSARTLENAINFEQCRAAMASSCKAQVQCFFADVCREVPNEVLQIGGSLGGPILDWELDQNLAVDSFGMYATQPHEPATGTRGHPSVFANALLQSFRGYGAHLYRGQWWISTADLAIGIQASMEQTQRGVRGPHQSARPLGGSRKSMLHRVSDPGKFPITVCLDPQNARDVDLRLRADGRTIATADGNDGEWEVLVQAREHTGEATPRRGGCAPYSTRFTPAPPGAEYLWELKCSR